MLPVCTSKDGAKPYRYHARNTPLFVESPLHTIEVLDIEVHDTDKTRDISTKAISGSITTKARQLCQRIAAATNRTAAVDVRTPVESN